MQTIRSDISGLKDITLARVVRRDTRRKFRKDCVLVAENVSTPLPKGYVAAIVSAPQVGQIQNKFRETPVVVYEGSDYTLSDNDVILINPAEKQLTVLFESCVEHNCLFVTERCNCRCLMCPQCPRPDSLDYVELNRRLIGLIKTDPEYLTITGGEPTLLGDDLVDLIMLCREKLPNTKLMVLTNARRLSNGSFVERLAKVSQGHLSFAVSIYADTEEEHDLIVGARGGFKETITGCHNLALYGLPVEIRVVLMRLNYMRLPEIADFIYRSLTFTFHVAIMGLELQDLAKDNLEQVWVDPYDYRRQLLEAAKYLYKRGLNVSFYNHQLCTVPRILWPLCAKSISRWKNVYMPICESCTVREICGGFFASSLLKYSDHIKPIY